MADDPLVVVDELVKAYDSSEPVLRGTSFTLARGQSASLVGSSGCGKSTLLAVLAGLMLPDAGTVTFDGEPLTGLDEGARAALRADRIGVVLQSGNLIPFLTATENVELAMELNRDRAPGRARDLLADLGLRRRADDYPRRLSGGEAQRVALAVALANDPVLLLADEVTGELDSATADQVADAIMTASRERGLTVLLVTHSAELASRTDQALSMVDGVVCGA